MSTDQKRLVGEVVGAHGQTFAEECGIPLRVDALGRGGYRRYDERTATQLGDGAELLTERWSGDLRRMREEADGDIGRLRELLQEIPGLGPAGADIFLREAQRVWPDSPRTSTPRRCRGRSGSVYRRTRTGW